MATPEQKATEIQIEKLENLIAELTANLEQEKSDIGNAGWGTAGELNYIASQLEQAVEFWNGGETE